MEKQLFETVISDLRDGGCVEDLSDVLRKVVAAVHETGKTGEIVIKLKVIPAGARTVMIEDSINEKLPQATPEKSMFFVLKDNSLSRRDPAQPELPLKIVESDNIQDLRKAE